MYTVIILRDKDRKFLKKLTEKYHFDPTKQLSDVLERKCMNTGLWIYEHETFQSWKDSPGDAVLWLAGGPGSGKTVMTASIIQALQNNGAEPSTTLILYYFVDGKEQERSDHLNLLPGLIHQILLAKPNLVTGVRKTTSTDEHFSSTLEKSTKLIRSIIKGIPKIFLIVDAIDECKVPGPVHDQDKGKARLLETLFELRGHATCLKLLVSSRTGSNSTLESVYRRHDTPKISLTTDLVRDDINQYLTLELRNFKEIGREGDKHETWENGMKQRIRETILADAGGMFLYAFMAWNTFRYWIILDWDDASMEKRFEILRGLAAGTNMADKDGIASTTTNEAGTLSAFYLNILSLLPSTGGTRGEEKTKKLFQWLVTANRPLSITELREVFILEPKHRSKACLGRPMKKEAFIGKLREYCGPLITINSASQTVHLYHHSVREFFLESDHRFAFTRTEAEIHGSIACLTYLSFTDHAETMSNSRSGDEIYQNDQRIMKDNPFLTYAAVYWPHHVAQVQGNSDLWELFKSWSESDSFGTCSRIFWYFKGKGGFPNKPIPMHILCFLGLEGFIQRALAGWMAMVHTCDSLGRTPLHWAAVNGDERIILLLIKHGANPKEIDTKFHTPLELALEFGNYQAVETLMVNDNDFEIPGKWVEMAVVGGHTSVLQILLDRGANANFLCPISTFGSPLHAAAYGGNEKLVGLLLRAGADIDYISDKFGTALQVAAFEGNVAVAMVLLDSKANPNSKATIDGTALQAAAQRGSVEIVQELIRRGADVMAPPGENLGTAMYLAKTAGHEAVVAILASLGAPLEGPRIERRESVNGSSMDGSGVQRVVELTKNAFSKGNQPAFERQLKWFRSMVHDGLFTENEIKLKWVLKFAAPYFDITVKMGREGHVAEVVDVAMFIIQDAVKSGYEKGLVMVTTTWTKALLSAIEDGKVSLVEKALLRCIGKFEALVEDNKQSDAKNLMGAGIELYFQMCKAGNQELIKLVANVWARAAENVIGGTFRDTIIAILDLYCNDWVKAVEVKDRVKVNTLTTAVMEVLLAAAGPTDAREAGRVITAHILLTLQRIVHHKDRNLKPWLCSEAEPISQVTINGESTVAVVGVGLDFFLAVIEGDEYIELREIFLGIGMRVLDGIARASLLHIARDTVGYLARQKLTACVTGGHRDGFSLARLERNLLGALELVYVAGDQIPQLRTVIEELKEAVKGHAEEAGRAVVSRPQLLGTFFYLPLPNNMQKLNPKSIYSPD